MSGRKTLRLASRRSPLAIWQAEHVAMLLKMQGHSAEVEIVGIDTEGDQRRDVTIAEIGGKGVFSKEVQRAVLDGRADLAVHSAKDLPAVTVEGLTLAAVPARADARDGLVGSRLAELPRGAVVASGSPRRRALLGHLRPDLVFTDVRGNMATRIEKVPEGGALVVAVAGLQRIGLDHHISEIMEVEDMIPQVGQGALAVECRADDDETLSTLVTIEHTPTRVRVDAERAFLAELGGDCDLPAGAHARFEGVQDSGVIILDAFLADSDEASAPLVRQQASGDDGVALGVAIARKLRAELEQQT